MRLCGKSTPGYSDLLFIHHTGRHHKSMVQLEETVLRLRVRRCSDPETTRPCPQHLPSLQASIASDPQALRMPRDAPGMIIAYEETAKKYQHHTGRGLESAQRLVDEVRLCPRLFRELNHV